MLPTLPAWALKLIRHAEHPPKRLLDEIAREGESAGATLCLLVRGEYAVDGEFPDEGWARVHAVELLGKLPPDTDALAVCLEQLELADVDHLTDAVVHTLKGWGAAVVPHVLPYVTNEDRMVANYAAEALSGCGAREDRILTALLALLAKDELGAAHLAQYGDPAALPALESALDAYEFVEERSVLCDQVVFELEHAIRTLGGELPPARTEKIERANRRRRRALRDLGIDPDAQEPSDSGLAGLFRAGLRPTASGRPALFLAERAPGPQPNRSFAPREAPHGEKNTT